MSLRKYALSFGLLMTAGTFIAQPFDASVQRNDNYQHVTISNPDRVTHININRDATPSEILLAEKKAQRAVNRFDTPCLELFFQDLGLSCLYDKNVIIPVSALLALYIAYKSGCFDFVTGKSKAKKEELKRAEAVLLKKLQEEKAAAEAQPQSQAKTTAKAKKKK